MQAHLHRRAVAGLPLGHRRLQLAELLQVAWLGRRKGFRVGLPWLIGRLLRRCWVRDKQELGGGARKERGGAGK